MKILWEIFVGKLKDAEAATSRCYIKKPYIILQKITRKHLHGNLTTFFRTCFAGRTVQKVKFSIMGFFHKCGQMLIKRNVSGYIHNISFVRLLSMTVGLCFSKSFEKSWFYRRFITPSPSPLTIQYWGVFLIPLLSSRNLFATYRRHIERLKEGKGYFESGRGGERPFGKLWVMKGLFWSCKDRGTIIFKVILELFI